MLDSTSPASAADGRAPDTSDASAVPTWDEIVERHSVRVYRLAYRLTGNKHDAEDLTQEVFVRVFRSLSSYTPGTFEGWLHRITTNLFLDGARRKAKIRFDALADDADTRLPSRAARSSESVSKRIRCLRRAPSRKRFVVIRCSQPSKVPGV